MKMEFEYFFDNDLVYIELLIELVQQVIVSMGLFDNIVWLRVGVVLEYVLLNVIYCGNFGIDVCDMFVIDQQLMCNCVV